MKEHLLANGFKQTGSCFCRGFQTHDYENGTTKVELSTTNYWIKRRNPVQWGTVSYGNQAQFQDDLQKWLQ